MSENEIPVCPPIFTAVAVFDYGGVDFCSEIMEPTSAETDGSIHEAIKDCAGEAMDEGNEVDFVAIYKLHKIVRVKRLIELDNVEIPDAEETAE